MNGPASSRPIIESISDALLDIVQHLQANAEGIYWLGLRPIIVRPVAVTITTATGTRALEHVE